VIVTQSGIDSEESRWAEKPSARSSQDERVGPGTGAWSRSAPASAGQPLCKDGLRTEMITAITIEAARNAGSSSAYGWLAGGVTVYSK
jgi:hypothetical protein